VDEGITHVGSWWFAGLGYLQEAVMPWSLQSIGEGAFKGCGQLPLFECSDKVKSIGNHAFEGCSNLHEFNVYDLTGNYKISEAALSIGSRAFADCNNLKYFNITANSTVGDEAFSGSGIESIDFKPGISFGKSVFSRCPLKSVTIPDNYTLGDDIFSYSTLETVIVNNNVNFGKQSFYNCKNLKSITFQGRINAVTEGMFYGCSSLPSVNIPNGATAIGKNAFNASGITSINIPNSVTSIGEYAFYKTKLTSVTILNSVTKLEANAFQSSGLISITVPGSVKVIEGGTFAFCNALTSVKLCEGIKSIGSSAFRGCPNLETVSLPASLDSIGECAFTDFSNLKVIECNGTTPPAMHSAAFAVSDLTKASLCVPYGSVEAYRNAPVWKNFKNIGTYPAGIRLDKHSVTARGNTALKLNAYLLPYDAVQSVEWHTKNINVAEVNNGTVRFKSPGTAAIVATTHNGIFKDSCLIRVLEDNLDGRPTFADSLLGEWVECDENLQDIPNPEIFGFWKTVTASPEGYQTISLNCRYNNGFVERTVSNFWFDETAGVVYIRTTANTYLGLVISELTANTITSREMVPANPVLYFKRVK
ncbi:MAG: leucine-rich repeat protein, partial [Dysgonamonadaceae bacterium]|nr:leucine-rich repeat protein [Dysgonamonadaceae bacterium]